MPVKNITSAQAREVVATTRRLLSTGVPKVIWDPLTMKQVTKHLMVDLTYRNTAIGVEVSKVKFRRDRARTVAIKTY